MSADVAPLADATPLEELIVRHVLACVAAGQTPTYEAIGERIGAPPWVLEGMFDIRSLEASESE